MVLECFTIVLRMYFLQKFLFLTLFWFSGNKLAQEMDQRCKLWVGHVSVETQIFKRFIKHCFYLHEYYLLWKFGGVRVQNKTKRDNSWMLNWNKKPWKFITWQPQILYWRNLPQLRTSIRSLYVKNLAVIGYMRV